MELGCGAPGVSPWDTQVAGAKSIGSVVGTATILAGPAAGALEGAGAAAEDAGNIVYRGLAEGENPAEGLVARDPGAGNDITSHIAGRRSSRCISTIRSAQANTYSYIFIPAK